MRGKHWCVRPDGSVVLCDQRHEGAWAALADWLDHVTERTIDMSTRMDPAGEYAKGCDCGICDPLRSAIAVARAYLKAATAPTKHEETR